MKDEKPKRGDIISYQCSVCSKIFQLKYDSRRSSDWKCRSCMLKSRHKNGDYENNKFPEMTDERKAIISKKASDKWNDPSYREKWKKTRNSTKDKRSQKSKRIWADEERLASLSSKIKERWNDPKYRKIKTEQSRELWKDDKYKAKQLEGMASNTVREIISRNSLAMWEDKNYQGIIAEKRAELLQDERFLQKLSIASSRVNRERWADPEIRAKLLEVFRSDEFRNKMAQRRAEMPRVSSIQKVLYSILDDLGVQYYKEHEEGGTDPGCIIGPYTFDCRVPRINKPDLLIECQGDYWHSLPQSRRNDQAKSTYINKYYDGELEIKSIWEHEFANLGKVRYLLKYWLGLHVEELIEYSFKQLQIRRCEADEYKSLLEKYHYLQNAGRGGMAYGAFLGDKLIAVCIFSPLIRQNIVIDSFKPEEVRELSRLCIHPNYQKKNLATWFISRCIKMLPSKYKSVISYCDTTYDHDGTVYKAANFVLDCEVRPDYWYKSDDGWIMHKKTLYGKARRMKMTESSFAASNGYTKVFGKKKLRFRYDR